MINKPNPISWLNYSLLLVGGYYTLPLAEVRAILNAEGIPFKILELSDNLLRIEAKRPPYPLRKRASLTRLCCIELEHGKTEFSEIIRAVRKVDWSIIDGKSFSVKVYKYGLVSLKENSSLIERAVGEIILKSTHNSRVLIKNPEVKVIVLISSKSFSIGLLLFERERIVNTRCPKLRPFFHPSSLDSVLARALVNLSRCKIGEIVLDPFVGSGSIIVEAALIGCEAVGIDVNASIVKGCLKNCVFYNVYNVTSILNADSLNYPLREGIIDRIVTDPPYGRISSTHGRKTREIIEGLLSLAQKVLRKGGILVFMHPKDAEVKRVINKYDVKLMEEHEIKVHKGLTRVIKVMMID